MRHLTRSLPPIGRLLRLAGIGILCILSGCEDSGMATRFPDIGDPEKGALLIQEIGCGTCHQIPGLKEANGLVGPPLDQIGKRIFIAGLLRNTPANMMTWIQNPQDVVPGNAMPDMGITEEQARDITAYLYSLD
jgi:cytochrome c2